MDRPNFLILGAPKAGTTSLHRYLTHHPDVFMVTPRDPLFFEAEYERGLSWYWNTFYGGWSGEALAGDARVANLFLPYVAPRIRECLPDARLVVILRNPVERAFSSWWMRVCRGRDEQSFQEALADNLSRIESGVTLDGEAGEKLWRANIAPDGVGVTLHPYVYLEPGYYARHLERYLGLFPRSQLKILFFDDLQDDAEGVYEELLEFLGLEVPDTLPSFERHNAAFSTTSMTLLRAARALGMERLVPEWIGVPVRRFLDRWGRVPSPDPATRRWLSEHYAPHNRALEALVGRDLSHWS